MIQIFFVSKEKISSGNKSVIDHLLYKANKITIFSILFEVYTYGPVYIIYDRTKDPQLSDYFFTLEVFLEIFT